MELNQLRYLLAVSKTLNFSKAAEELYISQPSLSQQIKRLEAELGVQLLVRNTRSVEMTDIGLAVVREAEKATSATDRIYDICDEENRRKSDRLNIGVLAVYPQLNLSNILADFQTAHQMQTVSVHFSWSNELIQRLLQKKTDIIVTNLLEADLTEEQLENMDIHVFLDDRLYAIVHNRHPLAAKQSVRLEDIIHEDLLLSGPASSVNILFSNAVKRAGLKMPSYAECPSITSIFNFIASGQGVTVMSKHVSSAYLKGNNVLLPIEPIIRTSTAIVTRKESLRRPIVREFRDFFLSRQGGQQNI